MRETIAKVLCTKAPSTKKNHAYPTDIIMSHHVNVIDAIALVDVCNFVDVKTGWMYGNSSWQTLTDSSDSDNKLQQPSRHLPKVAKH